MATVTVKYNPRQNVGRAPVGANLLQYTLTTASNGGAVAGTADSIAALAIADVVRLGKIPGGSVIGPFEAVISTGFTASVTGDLGFEYVDGVDDTDVPQDADYFANDQALTTAAVFRKATTTAPVTLPKDAWLTLTIAGAANAKVARLDVMLPLQTEGVA